MKISIDLKSFPQQWNKYWFSPEDPIQLGVLRILFFLIFWVLFKEQVQIAWTQIPLDFWQPISFFKYFDLQPPDVFAANCLIYSWNIATLFCIFGFLTPLSILICALTSLYFFGLRYCYGFMHPTDANPILICFIFVFSSCGYRLSVDSFLARRFKFWGLFRGRPPRAWTLKLIWLSWAMMFFSAGLAKLRHSGLQWVISDNLRNYIIHNQYWFHFRIFSDSFNPSLILIQFPLLCQIAAAAALALELASPLILFSRKTRNIIVLLLFVFQLANAFILLVDFYQSFLVYIFFVNWAFWIEKIRLRKNPTV